MDLQAALRNGLRVHPLQAEAALPLLVQPPAEARDWPAWLPALQELARTRLPETGALLLRGFDVLGEQPFRQLVRAFGQELLSYEFGSTPRKAVEQGVYSSTEYPAHQVIPLHNEQSYTLSWPLKIWFHCVQASAEGGETPIADSRRVYQCIDPALRARFAERRLMYVRNYGNGLDLPWEQAFNTHERAEVERFCRAHQIDYQWKADGELRTRQVCQAEARHPHTGAMVWFNQAHLFHISNLAPAVREGLLAVVEDPLDLPRNVYYGDGSPLEEDALAQIRHAFDSCTVRFPWQPGDVMLLDNMLVAHGRSSFKGPRKVVVAMTEPVQE